MCLKNQRRTLKIGFLANLDIIKKPKIYKEVDMFVRKGQGLVEYALILVLVAVVVIVVLALLGPTIGAVFSNIIAAI